MDLAVDRTSDVPLGAQLAASLRDAIRSGRLAPGDRLPSVRELAVAAGINVNTARAVYARLEREGFARSEQGRGTFVAPPTDDAATRRELRTQIAALESELARRPPPAGDPFAERRPASARLMDSSQLRAVRDDLRERLRMLDAERADLLRRIAEFEELEPEPAPEPERRSSSVSLPGARVRWVGA